MKKVAMFKFRLSENSPAPEIIDGFVFEGKKGSDLKTSYNKGLAILKSKYKQYKYIRRFFIADETSADLMVILEAQDFPEIIVNELFETE